MRSRVPAASCSGAVPQHPCCRCCLLSPLPHSHSCPFLPFLLLPSLSSSLFSCPPLAAPFFPTLLLFSIPSAPLISLPLPVPNGSLPPCSLFVPVLPFIFAIASLAFGHFPLTAAQTPQPLGAPFWGHHRLRSHPADRGSPCPLLFLPPCPTSSYYFNLRGQGGN